MGLQYEVTYLHVMPRLLKKGVKINTESFLAAISEKTATVVNTNTMDAREITDVDTFVLITGKIPIDNLYNELQGKMKELYKIGDAKNPHNMGSANRDGHFVGRFL
jgi:hypothetical protein